MDGIDAWREAEREWQALKQSGNPITEDEWRRFERLSRLPDLPGQVANGGWYRVMPNEEHVKYYGVCFDYETRPRGWLKKNMSVNV